MVVADVKLDITLAIANDPLTTQMRHVVQRNGRRGTVRANAPD